MVDARSLHSFVCKKAPGKTIRHHSLNELIARSFSAAGVPVVNEPTGLSRSDRKRPDGLSLIPWQNGKALCWDITSHLPVSQLAFQTLLVMPGRQPNSLHPARK